MCQQITKGDISYLIDIPIDIIKEVIIEELINRLFVKGYHDQ